jgi:SGNH domain (fused to AT3 domains)
VVGDSYAQAAYGGMLQHFGDRAHVDLVAASACEPIACPASARRACRVRNELLFDRLDYTPFDVVFVIARIDEDYEVAQVPDAVARLRARGAKHVVVVGAPISYAESVTDMLSVFGGRGLEHVMARVAATASRASSRSTGRWSSW